MSRYTDVYANENGPDDARPTARQIIQDYEMEGKLTGKLAVITGGAAGLGLETTRALAATGITLYLTARDLAKAKASLGDLFNPTQMKLIHMDQTSFDSVRSAATSILSSTDKIHILINNAGIMAIPTLTLTSTHETQFMTNHLSHFLFFRLLQPALLNAATPSSPSKVINLSASAHRLNGINASNNYAFQHGGYTPWGAYAQSKTANIYMASCIDRQYASQHLRACSVHPGISFTNIGHHIDADTLNLITTHPKVPKTMKSPSQAAATTVWAAVCDWAAEGVGGKYIVDCAVAEKGEDDGDRCLSTGVSWTYDREGEERLWRDSLGMVGLGG